MAACRRHWLTLLSSIAISCAGPTCENRDEDDARVESAVATSASASAPAGASVSSRNPATSAPSPITSGGPGSGSATSANVVPSASAPTSRPGPPFSDPLPDGKTLTRLPAMQYVKLSPNQCRAELRRRGIPFRHAPARKSDARYVRNVSQKSAPKGEDIRTPVRLTKALHGVTFVTPAPPSPFGRLDCRLAVALDALATIVSRYDVIRVHVDNMYRPHATIGGTSRRSQHAEGLAIDIMSFDLASGRTLLVERDWRSALGKPYCGPNAALPPGADEFATTLRNLVCEVVRAGIFHHAVTPSDDRSHRDHVHFDLDGDATRVRVEP